MAGRPQRREGLVRSHPEARLTFRTPLEGARFVETLRLYGFPSFSRGRFVTAYAPSDEIRFATRIAQGEQITARDTARGAARDEEWRPMLKERLGVSEGEMQRLERVGLVGPRRGRSARDMNRDGAPRTFPLENGFRLAVRPYPWGRGGRELEWQLLDRSGRLVDSGEAFDMPDARRAALASIGRRRGFERGFAQPRRGGVTMRGLVGRDRGSRSRAAARTSSARDHLAVPPGGFTEYRPVFRTEQSGWIADDVAYPSLEKAAERADTLLRHGAAVSVVEERAYNHLGQLVARVVVYRSRARSRHFAGDNGEETSTTETVTTYHGPPSSRRPSSRRPAAARERFVFQSAKGADVFEYRLRAEGYRPRREGPMLVIVRAPDEVTRAALNWVRTYARDGYTPPDAQGRMIPRGCEDVLRRLEGRGGDRRLTAEEIRCLQGIRWTRPAMLQQGRVMRRQLIDAGLLGEAAAESLAPSRGGAVTRRRRRRSARDNGRGGR